MSDLKITPVQTDEEIMEFIAFPWEVYKDNDYWVPPLISERLEFLDKDKNAFFEHAEGGYYIARRGERVVGTIAAFTNQLYNEFQGVNWGFFGLFEVLEDPEAARALLRAAESWARVAGHDKLVGPAQFSTNDEVGLLLDSYDDAPRLLMTYNPPYYVDYVESAGFSKARDLWAYELDLDEFIRNIPDKLPRVVEKTKKRYGYSIRPMNMKDFDREVERFKKIYNTSWEKNWGFVPMTDPEFQKLAADLKQILDPNLVLMVEHEGEVVGAALSVEDVSQALRPAYPRPGTPELWTMLKLLWYWKVRPRITWMRTIALGVLPEHRGRGVDAMMYLETAYRAQKKGIKKVEMSWILDNNVPMNRAIQMLGGELYKTYRMYEKAL
jgi:GNAT superfamily N-acetyltransferase